MNQCFNGHRFLAQRRMTVDKFLNSDVSDIFHGSSPSVGRSMSKKSN